MIYDLEGYVKNLMKKQLACFSLFFFFVDGGVCACVCACVCVFTSRSVMSLYTVRFTSHFLLTFVLEGNEKLSLLSYVKLTWQSMVEAKASVLE